jgi:hypothetical protein
LAHTRGVVLARHLSGTGMVLGYAPFHLFLLLVIALASLVGLVVKQTSSRQAACLLITPRPNEPQGRSGAACRALARGLAEAS